MVGGTFTLAQQHSYGWRKSKGRSHLFLDYPHVSFLISVWILVPRSIWPLLKKQLKMTFNFDLLTILANSQSIINALSQMMSGAANQNAMK